MNLGLSVLPSSRQEVFLELAYCFFLKLGMMLVGLMRLCVTESGFSRKIIYCPQNGENCPEMRQK